MENTRLKTKANKVYIEVYLDKETNKPAPKLVKGNIGSCMGRLFGIRRRDDRCFVDEAWSVTDLETGTRLCWGATREEALSLIPKRMEMVTMLLESDNEAAHELAKEGRDTIREALDKMYLGCMIEGGDDAKYLETGMLPFKATDCRHANPAMKKAKTFDLDEIQVFQAEGAQWWDIEAHGYNEDYQRIA